MSTTVASHLATNTAPRLAAGFLAAGPGIAAVDTRVGSVGVAWTPRGVDLVLLPDSPCAWEGHPRGSALARLQALCPERPLRRRPPPAPAEVLRRIRRHLAGEPDPLLDVPVDLAGSGSFACRVLLALREVLPGATVTYGELARRAGRAGAARAVGRVMAANPVPLLVPCHRCLPAGPRNGGRDSTLAARAVRPLGGFSGGGGPRQKAHLLFLEGVVLDPHHQAGLEHLGRVDPLLRRVIRIVGPYHAAPERREPPYAALLRAIIHQQLSIKAGATIARRVAALTPGPGLPQPQELLALEEPALRAAGLSGAKVRYARDLATRLADGRLSLAGLARRPDDEVIETLTAVSGIGRWTAQMFLIFQLGRLDVLPVDDLGLRAAVQKAWRLPAPVSAADLARRAEPWRPYRSMASWYLWQALDAGAIGP
ncbi:MAG: methylated-DNA--[protein]-cysteine S-methyltransferase [Candidatus Krumholzibacteriia bacterium]